MSQTHPDIDSHPDEPPAKHSRRDPGDSDPIVDSIIIGASQMTVSSSLQTTPNPNYVHRLKLDGRATISNAADTRYFSKNKALVYQFVDLSNAVEDELGQLVSCTLECGICGRGKWRWIKGGKSKGSTSNMTRHMKDKHHTIWLTAERADKAAWQALNEVDETTGEAAPLLPPPVPAFNMDEFYKKLTCWIVTGNPPFTEVENDEFRELLVYLRPALQTHLVQSTAIKEWHQQNHVLLQYAT